MNDSCFEIGLNAGRLQAFGQVPDAGSSTTLKH